MMTEREFSQFESRIMQLLHALKEANGENRSLRERLTKTLREKAELADRQRLSVNRVKQLISRLKNLS